ncbi:MAG: TatD family hydrolase [Candidatus Colwellbacteria bacterium]|nr:TatD family hydrolase [Candidatus Colwellbacteria bacterium]
MPPRLIDTHAHLQFPEYDADRDAVIGRALSANVWHVNVGTTLETSREAVRLAERFEEGVYAAVGVHPSFPLLPFCDPEENRREDRGNPRAVFEEDMFRELVAHPKVLAIGECGFDRARVSFEAWPLVRAAQEEVFLKHVALAAEAGKPIAVHCRDAYDDLLAALSSAAGKVRGVAHFFSGNVAHARRLLDLGFSFSFGGAVTFGRAYDDLVRFIPLDRIFLETDAPYVAPAPHRGERNEPLYVERVAERIAEIKDVSSDEVARATTENALAFFGLANMTKPAAH